MTEEQRERDIELAMLMLKEYNEVFNRDTIDLQTAKEQMLAETDQEFTKTFSIVLELHDLTERHIEFREMIESINTYGDNYIKNIFMRGLD